MMLDMMLNRRKLVQTATVVATALAVPATALGDDIPEECVSDVVVVGGGTSGLVTALSALESGLSVALVTASSVPVARGGSNNAIYSKAMERYGLPRVSWEELRAEMLFGSYQPDQRKWSRYYNNSEEAMNWLIDIMEGVGYQTVLEDCAGFPPESPFYQPTSSHCWCKPDAVIGGGGQGFVVEVLAQRIVELGGRIDYCTVGRQLVRGGEADGKEGRVEALLAEQPDGSTVRYTALKAVVLATGDFSANAQMMQEHCGWAAPYYNDRPEPDYDVTITMQGLYRGEGHTMGLGVGASWQHINPCCPMGGNVCVGPWRQLQENFLGLLVNRDGERYMDEAATSALGGMPALTQPGHEVTAIWNAAYAAANEGFWHGFGSAYDLSPVLTPEEVLETWDANVEAGQYVKANTLEELVEKLGLPAPTLQTIERYNELCDAGEDIDFHKDAAHLIPLHEGPFYGTTNSTPDTMTVLGGLRTDPFMRVCDEEDRPIEGLFNVGSMVGDFYAGVYTFQLQGLNLGACCLTFGYLTGKYIAENL